MKPILIASVILSGCATTGPVVSKVAFRDDGSVRVQTCNLRVSYVFTMQADLVDCEVKTQEAPASSSVNRAEFDER